MFIPSTEAARIAAVMRGAPMPPSLVAMPTPEPPKGLPRALAALRAKQAHEQAEREELDAIAEATMPRATAAPE
jgi:hypothetical protein